MKIVISDWLTVKDPSVSESVFEQYGSVKLYDLTKPEELAQRLGDAEVLLCNKTLVTEETMKQCPNLKYIGLFATGYNNIDIEGAKKYGITVCNAGSYSTEAVAQHTFAMILDHYSKIAAYHHEVQQGSWKNSAFFCAPTFPTWELMGKTIGIYGYGSIGQKVAELAQAFGMKILVCTRTPKADCPYSQISKEEIFEQADILTFHCPLNEGTKEIICRENLEKMKPTAILINTARGGLVVEQDLAQALQEKRLAKAYLDVLSVEPMEQDCPLYQVENCVITPHVAWSPAETRQRLFGIVEKNLALWQVGTLQNVIVKGK